MNKEKYSNQEMENIPIRERKIFQLRNGKYFQSELVNWEMAEQQEDENKHMRPQERAHGQKQNMFSIKPETSQL